MNAIGDQLRTAREARGLSIEYVADETNIAKRYIAAMESEDFSVFPGEPYIIGFLRNYAEYLGLESGSIVQAFRGIRIQEQPVPLTELLPPKKMPAWPLAVAGLVVALALGAFLIFRTASSKSDDNAPTLAKAAPVQHTLDRQRFEKRLYEGDSVLVPFGADTYRLTVAKIDDRVSIDTPVGLSRFMMGEEGSIDLDKDNKPELVVFVVDFQKNEASRGAVLRFDAAGALASAISAPGSVTSADAAGLKAAGDTTQATTVAVSSAAPTASPERPATQESIVFASKRSPYPFVLNVTFRNYAMFRHEIDRHDREERYYHKGDQISVTANNSAKLWTSNAAACKLTIQASGGQTADVELGLPGEVAVKQVRWVQADDGLWSLGVYDVN